MDLLIECLTFDGLRELILRGQFLHACSPELAVFIKEHMPCDLENMVEWAGVFAFSRSDTRTKEVNRKPSQVAGQNPTRATDSSSATISGL